MRTIDKPKSRPNTALFTDLPALVDWHQQFAAICMKKAERLANTATVTDSKQCRSMQRTYMQRAQMHQSAVALLTALMSSTREKMAV